MRPKPWLTYLDRTRPLLLTVRDYFCYFNFYTIIEKLIYFNKNIDYNVAEKTKVVNKVDVAVANKWVKVDLCQDEEGEFSLKTEEDDTNISDSRGLFKKRGGNFPKD
jgi:hypothetical protein